MQLQYFMFIFFLWSHLIFEAFCAFSVILGMTICLGTYAVQHVVMLINF